MRYLLIAFLIICGLTLLTGLITYVYFSATLPNIDSLAEYEPHIATEVYAKNGEKIGEFYQERRLLIPFEQIPKFVIDAFVSAEDKRYWEHRGIDLEGIFRALVKNIKARRVVQGGSTLTQQVAKNLLLSGERSISRKIKEQILALKIEKRFNKQQILYIYLNQIYLGHGAYGVQAAASNFFNKNVNELTLGEAALLAGLPQAPGKLSDADWIKERQDYVLTRMVEDKFISEEDSEKAKREAIKILRRKDFNLKIAPHFAEHVRRYLMKKYGSDMVYSQGLKVYTTIDLEMQQAAQKAVITGLENLDKRQGYRGPIAHHDSKTAIQAALLKIHHEQIATSEGYKLLQPATNNGKDFPEETPTPVSIGTKTAGLVTNLSDKEVYVQIGNRFGIIPFETMRWARTPNPEIAPWEGSISHPTEAVKVGDEILVKIIGFKSKDKHQSKENLLDLRLEQEPEVEGALLSYNLDGGIVAMVGGYDFENSEYNRAIQAKRQPGSAFKPIIYSAAIDKGFTPATIIVDSPIVYGSDEEIEKWKPENYEQKFYGDTTLRTALIHSRNIVTIKILQQIKIPYAVSYARKIGITSPLNEDLSLGLGSSSLYLSEITEAFATFPKQGRKLHSYFIEKIESRDGKILEEHIKPVQLEIPPAINTEIVESDNPDQIISPQTAYIMTHLLKEVVHHGTGRSVRLLGRPAAGKTGTTNDFTDALFIGFTPNIVTGVWTGFDDRKSLGKGESGARAASPIWLEYMQEAVKKFPVEDFDVPPNIVFASIDRETGKLAGPNTKNPVYEAFISGTEPSATSTEQGEENAQPIDQEDEEFFKEEVF